MTNAFVAAEDKDFYPHPGVNFLSMARAAFTDVARLRENRRPIGASTITQQVAKNFLLGNEMSLKRKIKEALVALRMEQVLSKQRILELYLNEIYLGRGSYGVAAAALTYFNKPLDQLDVAEAAFLAALPKAPSSYNPDRYPQAAKDRRDWVIDRMADDGFITQAQAIGRQGRTADGREAQRLGHGKGAVFRRGGAPDAGRALWRKGAVSRRPDGTYQPRSEATGKRRARRCATG